MVFIACYKLKSSFSFWWTIPLLLLPWLQIILNRTVREIVSVIFTYALCRGGQSEGNASASQTENIYASHRSLVFVSFRVYFLAPFEQQTASHPTCTTACWDALGSLCHFACVCARGCILWASIKEFSQYNAAVDDETLKNNNQNTQFCVCSLCQQPRQHAMQFC